jgi:stage VI sporulation protein D
LARKEEPSESHTKVKVCIVQKGDTIDMLSDRYDVSVTHLQRLNNLEINQDVFEGQVLYIPAVQNQK